MRRASTGVVRGTWWFTASRVVSASSTPARWPRRGRSSATARRVCLRRGPTLHGFSLSWLDRYAGAGHDSVRANTRREYRRLLVNFALTYFDREVRVRDLDRAAVQQFVDWLTTRPGRGGRLCDRSIANALTPLRLALDAAVAEGLLDYQPGGGGRAAAAAGRSRMVDARAPLSDADRARASVRRGTG